MSLAATTSSPGVSMTILSMPDRFVLVLWWRPWHDVLHTTSLVDDVDEER
jgi:hypothetical protein